MTTVCIHAATTPTIGTAMFRLVLELTRYNIKIKIAGEISLWVCGIWLGQIDFIGFGQSKDN